MLTKEQILSKRELDHQDVECFGGTVRVRAMTAAAKDRFEQLYAAKSKKGIIPNLRAFFLVHCIVDEKGELMFGLEDVDALGEQGAAEIDKLFEVAQKLSGLTAEDEETLKK